jgi:hypothetical protein
MIVSLLVSGVEGYQNKNNCQSHIDGKCDVKETAQHVEAYPQHVGQVLMQLIKRFDNKFLRNRGKDCKVIRLFLARTEYFYRVHTRNIAVSLIWIKNFVAQAIYVLAFRNCAHCTSMPKESSLE